MTDLFQTLIDTDHDVAAFPIHEYWMDVGRFDDLQQASDDFSRIFE
jgi:NDP-sugar pyrophosphorylase family protein